MHLVQLQGIWVEDILKWFNQHILDSGGDGAGAIVCANPREVADYFVREYWGGKLPTNFCRDETFDEITISYHDGNENYIFTDRVNFNFGMCTDYVFKITGVCRSYKDGFTILPI